VLRYRAAGLEIESGLALPGLREAPAGGAPPDVVVRVGGTPPGLANALERGANWERAAGVLQVSVPGLARFLIREAGEIVIEPDAGAAVEDVAIIVAGPLIGLFLHLRGQIVLQASAVAVDGAAVLICGETAAGKSTLVAALGRRGYPAICDDLCAIDMAATGGPRALSDAATLKLWADAIRRLDTPQGPPVRAVLQKHHVAPPAGSVAAAPVRAIYALREARPSDSPGIQRPNVVDRALLVRRAAFRPNVVRALDQRAAYFAAAARLAGAAGVFTFTRSLGFDRMDDALDALEAHWSEIGLAPGKAA
jgi:hypothetical protein